MGEMLRRAVTLVVLGLLAAGCAGDDGALKVVIDAHGLQCGGARVRTVQVNRFDSDFAVPAAEIRKGMRCGLSYHVINTADDAVVLDETVVPLMGPNGGAGVEAVMLSPLGSEPKPADDADAIFSMDEYQLQPGEAEEFEVVFEHRPDGCTSLRSNIHFSDAPIVTADDGNIEASHFGPAYAFIGTPDSSCDD